MKLLNKISNQQFYFSNIEEIEQINSIGNNSAIVIDENNLDKLLSDDRVSKNVNQIIIITENVYPVMQKIKFENILLIAASDVQQAIKFTTFQPCISENVVFYSGDLNEVISHVNSFIIPA